MFLYSCKSAVLTIFTPATQERKEDSIEVLLLPHTSLGLGILKFR
jgi:hypothetical protein